jgi:hypothetical protein
MDGVAYTFGSHTHKEIHFSLDYIFGSAGKVSGNSSVNDEIKDGQVTKGRRGQEHAR